jgi:hypothetical protein
VAERRLVVLVRRPRAEAGVDPGAERARPRLERCAVGQRRRAHRAAVRLLAGGDHGAPLERPAAAAVLRKRRVELLVGVARIGGPDPTEEHTDAPRRRDEGRVLHLGPIDLHRRCRPDPAVSGYRGVDKALGVRAGAAMPRHMEGAVSRPQQAHLVDVAPVRCSDLLPRRSPRGRRDEQAESDSSNRAAHLHERLHPVERLPGQGPRAAPSPYR